MTYSRKLLAGYLGSEYRLILLNVFAFLAHLIDEIRNHGDLPSIGVYGVAIFSVSVYPLLPVPFRGVVAIASGVGYSYGMMRYHFFPFLLTGDTTSIYTAMFVQVISIMVIGMGTRILVDFFLQKKQSRK